MGLETAGILTLIGMGVGAGANIYGAKKKADAEQEAARLQTEAATRSAELQSKAQADALAYTKQEADRQQANFENTQHNNYDQWAAREGRLGSLGEMIGAGPRNTPAYRGSSQPGAPSGPMPTVDPSKGDIGAQVSAYFKSRGVSDAETPYWVSKWPELMARGKELNDPHYANKRLADADVFGGGGVAPAPQSKAGTIGATLAPSSPSSAPPLTPALPPPSSSSAPGWGSIAALLAAGAGAGLGFAKNGLGSIGSVLNNAVNPKPMPTPGYYSNFMEGPQPGGSIVVPPMVRGTTGLVYDPMGDRWVSPEEYGQNWGSWGGGQPPTPGRY